MIGTRLGDRYEILEPLGRGGMGLVFKARDPRLDREVAVKVVPSTLLDDETMERFEREAQIVARMDHPGIITIHDFGKHEGALYFVMPVVRGKTLRARMREKALTLGDVLEICAQVAEALEYSHGRGIVHRDIKPENVMVVEEDGRPRVRVMDFGLARGATDERLTESGMLVGTIAYLAPEQVAGALPSPATDLYALGVVLYECLVGDPPFSGSVEAILYRVAHEPPAPPSTRGVAIDGELEATVLRMLEKEPLRRPASAGEAARRLRALQAQLRDDDRERVVEGARPGAENATERRVGRVPLLGRQRELASLVRGLEAAIAGNAAVVAIEGEAGVGKSRLVDELEPIARVRGATLVRGRFVDQDRTFPLQGFGDLLRDHFRARESETATSVGRSDFEDLAPDLVALFPALGELAPFRGKVSDSRPTGKASLAAAEDRTFVFELLARALLRLAGENPTVFVFENLHAAEVSLEALSYVLQRLGATRTLVVVTYRGGEVDRAHPLTRLLRGLADHPSFESLRLERLGLDDHRQLIRGILGGGRVDDRLVQAVHQATEGNPFFSRELLRSLVDSGGVAIDGSAVWTLLGSVNELPATIQQAVEKRVAALAESDRELLSIAALVGRVFDLDELEELVPDVDLDDAMVRLGRLGMLEEERASRGDRYSFSSAIVCDVLAASVPRRRRRSLHRRIAERLEARHSGRLERAVPRLAYHFAEGDVPEQAVTYGIRAARQFLGSFSGEDALRALEPVLEFLADEEWAGDRRPEAEARALAAEARRLIGDLDGARRESDAVVRIRQALAEPDLLFAALAGAAELAWEARDLEATRAAIERALAVPVGPPDVRARLLSLGVTIANLRGEADAARDLLESLDALRHDDAERQELPAGGVLDISAPTTYHGLEPSVARHVEDAEVLANVFETLIGTDERGGLVPRLAERWESRENGRIFRFRLRAGVALHDGRPLDAALVKAALERTIRLAPRHLAAALAAIRGTSAFLDGDGDHAGIRAVEPMLLEIELFEPLPIYPAMLTDLRTAVAAAGADGLALGTGPFRIVEHGPQQVTLAAMGSHWQRRPRIERLRFHAELDGEVAFERLRAGEIDIACGLGPENLERALRERRFRGGVAETTKKNSYFLLHSRSGQLAAQREAREALGQVLRIEDLVRRALGRSARPASGLLPPGILGHDPGRRRSSQSATLAAATIAQLGRPLPITLRAAVHPDFFVRYRAFLDDVRRRWQDIGVAVDVVTPNLDSYLAATRSGEGIDVLFGRWIANYDDPDAFAHGMFHSQIGTFRAWVSGLDIDSLAEQARATVEPKERERLYRALDDQLIARAWVTPLFHDVDVRLAGPQVLGLELRPALPYANYDGVAKSAAMPTVTESGGRLRIPVAGKLASLDPATLFFTWQFDIVPNVFETLTRATDDARVVPWLAREVTPLDGGTAYRIRLRSDVRFHDGRSLSARDVRYSFERLLASPQAVARNLLSPIRGAKAMIDGFRGELEGLRIESDDELTIQLDEPVGFFPTLLTGAATAILPEGLDQFTGSMRDGVVGTGPFRISRFAPDQTLELDANPSYWRRELPRSEGVAFEFGVEPAEAVAGFRAGRYSLLGGLAAHDAEELRRDRELAARYLETPTLSTYYLAFNCLAGPFADDALRRRLAASLDVPSLIRRHVGRRGVPARTLTPPGLSSFEPARRMASMVSGGARARGDLKLLLSPVYADAYPELLTELLERIGELGFRVQTQPLAGQPRRTLETEHVDISLSRWVAAYPDPDYFAYPLLHSKHGLLGPFFADPELDGRIERARGETRAEARREHYAEIENRIADRMMLLPLFHEQAYRFARPDVRGFALRFTWPTVELEKLSVEKA